MTRASWKRRWVPLTLAVVAVGGCVTPPSANGTDFLERDDLVPPGFGSLRQDEITLSLRSGDLLIKVTPLDEAVIRLTAPDTYQRLSALAEARRPDLERLSVRENPQLFLVSFFSYEPNVIYQAEDLQLVSLGLRYRPAAVVGVTPGWESQRLEQEELEMALYAFDPDLDLTSDLQVEYDRETAGGWDGILNRLDAERARVRARAGAVDPGRAPAPGIR